MTVTRARGRRAALVVLALLAVLAADAGAHGRSTSTSAWEMYEGARPAARVVVRVQLSDLQQTVPGVAGLTVAQIEERPALRRRVDGYLTDLVELRAGAAACAVASPVAALPTPDVTHLTRAWRIECAEGGAPELRVSLFFEALPSHLHLARVTLPGGEVIERVFVLDDERLALAEAGAGAAAPAAHGSGFLDYLSLGIEHIATGADHLFFLLALLLVGVSVREVATIVTGFTVAHSVTLALGVLGVVEPLPAAIEALIGLSIAVVALENFALTAGTATRRLVVLLLGGGSALATAAALSGAVVVPATALAGVGIFSLCYLGLMERSRRSGRLRWFIAFVFGLVHGFGFAGLLTEIGLPADRLAAALLGFNVGVEIGQLAIVAVAWPLLAWALRGSPQRNALLVQLGSTPVLVAGLYWFLTRALS